MMFFVWVVIKVLIGLIMVIGYLNITGRSQVSQMTPIDLFGNFIMGGVVGGILYNDKIDFWKYVFLLFLCILVMASLNYLTRKWALLRKASIGRPIPIIENGRFVVQAFEDHRSRLDIHDLASNLRMQGIFGFDRIQFAQIEPTGNISVIQGDKTHPTRFVVFRGKLLQAELEAGEFDEEWVLRELMLAGEGALEQIFLAEWCYERMVIIRNDGQIIRGPLRPGRSVNAQNPLPLSRVEQIAARSWGAVGLS